ncbi:inositol 1,4,5-triphosphate receptor associated 2 [Pyxicephalus adspersus]|uniref:inositol 1,4,5-triphosphate receptor associated 2 n=1 Tax=Pyxicephalus adspersus TaxID=30357 RepID=UPI003B5A63E7
MGDSGSATKRHNPVDSIRRKIKTIEMRDQESNPHLQIPKFQSRNFDSPQSSTKKDLEEVLKNRAMKSASKEAGSFSSPSAVAGFSPRIQVHSPLIQQTLDCDSPLSSMLYSASVVSKEKAKKVWPSCSSQSCSTPVVLPRDTHFKFHQSTIPGSEFKSVILEDRILPSISSFYFEQKSENFTLRSPVVKRLSMSESAGLKRIIEHKAEPAAEVSLICEEDLLDSIFHACDTEHRGKVAVSKIVDYLRHTTSRGSEDSGLSELCQMLDPEKRDISMDLDTYHAIMKEWVDDCRNNATEIKLKESAIAEDSMIKLRDSLMAVRRISGTTMNITSGSLEAFGGDISRDLDTSDLITCVADLQYNNQKLQEQKGKLKSAIEAQEETNHRLLEENEELRNQWRSAQQSISKARALKGELEEMKSNMNLLEEAKAKLVAQNKQMEKENIGLIHKISALQEENHRSTLDVEEVRKTLSEVSDKTAVLQIQLTEFEGTLQKKDAELLVKDLYVEELKSTLIEYSSVIENLRIEKSKLEHNLQQMEQELLSNGINSPITYKLNRVINGGLSSLHTELEFAQQSPEVSTAEWMFPLGRTSTLDVTLDREVLLLLQGPGHEQLAAEFKAILQTMQDDTCVMGDQVLQSLQRLIASDIDVKDLSVKMLEVITADLKEKKANWEKRLKQLDKNMESMDREFIKMSGNVRRMKTEKLHIKKELSSRTHELEAARQQLEEAEERERQISAQLHGSTEKQEDLSQQVAELQAALDVLRTEVESLQGKLEEAKRGQKELEAVKSQLLSRCQDGEERAKQQQDTISALEERLLNYQHCNKALSGSQDDGSDLNIETEQLLAHGEEEKSCICEGIGRQEAVRLSGPPKTSEDSVHEFTPLLDALSLELGEKYLRARSWQASSSLGRFNTDQDKVLGEACDSSADLQTPARTRRVSLGIQTDVQDPDSPAMEKTFSKEIQENVPGAMDNTSSLVNSHGSPNGTQLNDMAEAAPASAIQPDSLQDSQATKDGESTIPEKESDGEDKMSPTEVVGPSPLVKNLQCAEDNHTANNDKELETEFLRLSLGFKCDIFTLEKRLRLEERSRDLAEENLKKELSSCKKLLEALTPLCEDDNQTHEIVKKLDKSLQFLSQHTARVASRAEMLGAIHQESRVSKAVEVMIQHVENLKRMYAKEHAELEELREAMQQSDRSSTTIDRDDALKLATSLASKVSPARRVSMPAYTRGIGTAMDIFGGDKLDNKMHRRSNSWKLMGSRQNDNRPTLQRFVDNYTRPEPAEEDSIKEDEPITELAEEIKEEKTGKYSLLQKTPSPTKPESTYSRVWSWTSDMRQSITNINKPLVISIIAAFLFVTLAGFLTGLSFNRPVEGAPVGPGVSWTSIQQLLWPYTGLRHNGPPPV